MVETLVGSLALDTSPTSRNHILEELSVTVQSRQIQRRFVLLVSISRCVLDF